MNLEHYRQFATPGIKKNFTDDVMDLHIAHETEAIANVDAHMPQVKSAETAPEVKMTTAHSEMYGCHPSRFEFDKNGNKSPLGSLDCLFTGVPKE